MIVAISDIHGCFEKLTNLLEKIKYDKNKDKLIILGDMIDRGERSAEVVKMCKELTKTYPDKVVILRGNHEQMAIEYARKQDKNWNYNGNSATIKSYKEYYGDDYNKKLTEDIEWFESLPFYHKEGGFVFVHAGIDANKPLCKQDEFYMVWAREEYLFNTDKYGYKVISGHTPTMFYGFEEPLELASGNYLIDTGAVYGGKLTACIIDNNKIKFIQE